MLFVVALLAVVQEAVATGPTADFLAEDPVVHLAKADRIVVGTVLDVLPDGPGYTRTRVRVDADLWPMEDKPAVVEMRVYGLTLQRPMSEGMQDASYTNGLGPSGEPSMYPGQIGDEVLLLLSDDEGVLVPSSAYYSVFKRSEASDGRFVASSQHGVVAAFHGCREIRLLGSPGPSESALAAADANAASAPLVWSAFVDSVKTCAGAIAK